ncbi:MAG: hypothetical protein FD180_3223 [Planctomycetota bacterium]|nr:MAG: hypothetical protein FD180_3223 [Planctomycetota bacterium]
MPRKGFTLAELLVLVALAALFLSFATPTLCSSRRSSRKTDCKNSLKQIGIYFTLYEGKFHRYPTPGSATWFSAIWRPDMATDGNLFRCAVVGKAGTGTHYRGLVGAGGWNSGTPSAPAWYSWPASGIDEHAPPDLPMACDGDQHGVPNHNVHRRSGFCGDSSSGDDRNVLFFQGRVDVFAIGSPMETRVYGLLGETNGGWAAPAGTK